MTANETTWTAITGSTGGIGREIVDILAARGNALILINRNASKAAAQKKVLAQRYPDLQVRSLEADLMDIGQIHEVIRKIVAMPGKLDALYNNSGVLTSERVLSSQGYESQFAVNTLAPYILIRGLMEKMARDDSNNPAMIVNFSSSAISSIKQLDITQLENPDKVGGLLSTYAHTKLAATVLAPALADDLKAINVLIRAIDPGATKTAMTTGRASGMPRLLAWLAPIFFSPANRQAEKIVASADPKAHQGRTGIFVSNGRVKQLPARASNSDVQLDLVNKLEEVSGS